MPNRKIWDNSDPAVSDEVFEDTADMLEDDDAEMHRDIATTELYDTQHSDGHTYNPEIAWEQGLVYTPPDDWPVLPSDDPQGAEVAAGFAQSMEASSTDEEVLEPDVDNTDVDIQNDVYVALRNNSETQHLTDISVRVHNGVATIMGTVQTDDDIGYVYSIVSELDGVEDVQIRLDVEE